MEPFKHPPSHLDHESPKFEGKPHIWIQWKGTNVCCDIHCECGAHCHFDGDFLYFFQCPHCERYWEVGTHVSIYEVTKERATCLQVVDPDEDLQAEKADDEVCADGYCLTCGAIALMGSEFCEVHEP